MTERSITQLGVEVTDDQTLEQLHLNLSRAGLLLGTQPDGQPLVLTVLRPEPTSVAVVGALGLVKMLTLRLLGVGALVLIQSPRPVEWQKLVDLAAGPTGLIRLVDAEPESGGSMDRPVVHVVDTAGGSSADVTRGRAWSTVLNYLERPTRWNVESLADADLVISGPLTPAEAALVAPILNISDPATIVGGSRTAVRVLGRDVRMSAQLALTETERWLVGSLTR